MLVCSAGIKTGVRRPAKSLRLDMAADGDDSSTGVCRTPDLGLVVAVSTSDRISGDRCQTPRAGRILRNNVGARRLSATTVNAQRQ